MHQHKPPPEIPRRMGLSGKKRMLEIARLESLHLENEAGIITERLLELLDPNADQKGKILSKRGFANYLDDRLVELKGNTGHTRFVKSQAYRNGLAKRVLQEVIKKIGELPPADEKVSEARLRRMKMVADEITLLDPDKGHQINELLHKRGYQVK